MSGQYGIIYQYEESGKKGTQISKSYKIKKMDWLKLEFSIDAIISSLSPNWVNQRLDVAIHHPTSTIQNC